MSSVVALKENDKLGYPFIDTIFSDEKWKLHTPTPNNRDNSTNLYWILRNKTADTRAAHPSVVVDCKNLIVAIVFHTREGKTVPSANQVKVLHNNLISLIAWLATDEHLKISSINRKNINRYIHFLRRRRTANNKSDLGKSTIAGYLYCITELYAYSDYLVHPMRTDPLNGESPYKYMGCSETDVERHPATPQQIVTPLILRSLAIVSQVSLPLLKNIRTLEKSNCNGDGAVPLSMKYYPIAAEDGYKRELYAVRISDLHYMLRMCVAAASVIITYLTGLRRSELLGLEVGCWKKVKENGKLPEHCTIEGRIYKARTNISKNKLTDEFGDKHSWIAPIDVIPSLEFLTVLSEKERKIQNTKKLWPISTTLAGSKSKSISNAGDVSFNSLNISLNKLPHYLDIDTEGWLINLMQGRKTFAKFVAMRDRTQLHALASQFGHIDRVVTELGYSYFLYDFSEELESEAFNSIYSSYETIINSESLSGIAGNQIKEIKQSYKGGFTKKTKDKFIKEMINADIAVVACDWGYCLYDKSASKCNKEEPQPSDVFKEPFLCSTCSNFCATEEHFEFWNEMKHENQEIKRLADKNSQTHRLAKERLKTIAVVIDNLEPAK